MSSSRMKEFVHQAFLKVKLALAFHIIINTPPGKTVEEFAQELHEAFIQALRNNNDPLLSKRPDLQQRTVPVESQLYYLITPDLADLSMRLANSLGTDSGYNSCDIDDRLTQIAGGEDSQVSCAFAEYQTPLNFCENIPKTLSANLDFVRGLIRLQDLVGKDDDDSAGSQQAGAANENSGSKYRVSVPSGVIQYALQSSNVEVTVKKSVQEILRHLCGIALIGPELPHAIYNWEGSLVQQSTTIIRKMSNDKPSQQAVVQASGHVAAVLIADILKNYSLENNMKSEYQVILLLQICGSIATCLEVLNILISNINIITSKCVAANRSESPLTPTERIINFESCFFILHLTEKLLNRYFALQEIEKSPGVNENKGSKEPNVTELWRDAWEKKNRAETCQNVVSHKGSDISKLLQCWCINLKYAANIFCIDYPLITVYINNCLNHITDYQQKQ